jgi:hypothetical protein
MFMNSDGPLANVDAQQCVPALRLSGGMLCMACVMRLTNPHHLRIRDQRLTYPRHMVFHDDGQA